MAWLRKNIIVVLCVFAVAIGLAGITVGYLAANSAADRAERKAAAAQAVAIANTIERERICTETHQHACRDLFDRIAKNLTDAQRFRLACAVLRALDRDAVREIKKASRCP